jgi:hypothetical protein
VVFAEGGELIEIEQEEKFFAVVSQFIRPQSGLCG